MVTIMFEMTGKTFLHEIFCDLTVTTLVEQIAEQLMLLVSIKLLVSFGDDTGHNDLVVRRGYLHPVLFNQASLNP